MVGANIKRKTWFIAVLATIAAVVNLALNLVLIPLYGAIGAAAATLIAYIVLALTAYLVNQLLYPIPFEIGRFIVALLVGMVFYVGSSFLTQSQATYAAWGISLCALFLYGGFLAFLIWLPPQHRKN
jgi:O-antigen/teichoic acid export membrane protein